MELKTRCRSPSVPCSGSMIAATFVLIFELDYPFRGDMTVSPAEWQEFLDSNQRRL